MSKVWLAADLVKRLKTQYAPASRLQVGDVVIRSDEDVWEVAEVHINPNAFLTILDADGNGFMEINPHEVILIVNRAVFGR